MPDDVRESGHEEPFLEIDTPGSKSGSYTVGFVLVIIISLLACGFLVFYKYRTDSIAMDKQSTLESLTSTIGSKNNQETEKRVNDINSAIKILTTEKKSKFLFKQFIDDFKTKITNDTKLNNLSIDSQGVISMDGESISYRSVADLAVSLKSFSKIDGVEMSGLSRSTDENTSFVNFSITANLVDWDTGSSDSGSELDTGVEDGGVSE